MEEKQEHLPTKDGGAGISSEAAELPRNVCSDEGDGDEGLLDVEGKAGRRAFVSNGGALERTWEQTLAHSQIYSQLTGL